MNKEDLKEIVKEFLSPYINAMVDYKKLCDEKNKEIERLNNDIKILLKENENKEKVILKYDNIINELEKYLIEYSQDLEFRCYANTFLDKIKELKGDSSNDK